MIAIELNGEARELRDGECVQDLVDALARKDYAAAYRMYGDGGQGSGMSEAEFAAAGAALKRARAIAAVLPSTSSSPGASRTSASVSAALM